MKAKITGQRLAIVFSLLFIAISLLLNLLFRTDLYVMSLNFIHHYQRSHRRELSRILNNLFSYFCSRRVLAGLTIFVMMLSKRKVMSLIYASYMMINFYFLVLLKQIFQDYRPFWTNAGVLSIQW